MTARIKIVPNSNPNAEGEWVEIDLDLGGRERRRWRTMEHLVTPFVPEGHHVVAVERGGGPPDVVAKLAAS
jgi:hypothetical protein